MVSSRAEGQEREGGREGRIGDTCMHPLSTSCSVPPQRTSSDRSALRVSAKVKLCVRQLTGLLERHMLVPKNSELCMSAYQVSASSLGCFDSLLQHRPQSGIRPSEGSHTI